MKKVLLVIIRTYQKTLSLNHGLLGQLLPTRVCRFYPSCSEYAKEAIAQKGALQGVWLACLRVGKCHPWHLGGVDNVK
ncbi:membrane protein insertion efficiency factor YidD [Patescibacteria group bacterium]|nr:membrane protein insertion efficiency factor YidD [Patescibacteria group bacterium]